MLELVVTAWLLALTVSTSLFVVVVLSQALARRVRASVARAHAAAEQRVVVGETSAPSAAPQAA